MENTQFDDFDKFAGEYRDIHGKQTAKLGVDSEYFSEFKIQQVRAEEGEENKVIKILDFGCGDGIGAKFLHQYFPLAQITGIDTSIKSIEVARGKKYPNSDFELFNGTHIPFADETFDIIYVSMVLHHIDKSLNNKIFAELKRVLKPGARIYIFEHNPFNPVTNYFVNTCEFDKDVRLLSPFSLKKQLANSGFKKLTLTFIFFFPRIGLLKKLVFMEKHLRWFFMGGQYYVKAYK